MTLQFQYPWVLFLLWMVPLVGVAWHVLTNRRTTGREFVSPVMAARLGPSPSPVRRLWQLSLLMTGLFLALIAAARPQWGMKEDTVYQRGRDLMVVLDVSRSMLATDVHPSRLGRAKVDLLDLIKQLRGDRVGLLAFRGRPILLCPLTTDYGFLSQTLEGANVDSAPAGETDIGDAILEALQTFQGDDGSHKAIVLVSDGDDLAGRSAEAAAKAKQQGVAIFTVGFGSSEGAPVPSPTNKKEFMNFQGHEVVSKLNNEILRNLAEQTGGAYVPVGLANVKLGDLYRNHLSRIAARDLEESVQRRYIERYQWFLFPAVLCFLTIAFFSRGQILRRSQKSEVRSQKSGSRLFGVLVCGLAASLSHAQTNVPPDTADTNAATQVEEKVPTSSYPEGREGARVAQKLYLLGKYEEAAAAYQNATRTAASANRDDYLFNAACALLKAGKTDDAADLFRNLTGLEGQRGSDASYNLGCALFKTGSTPMIENAATPPDPTVAEHRAQALKQAGTAFQKALRQEPGNADSRKNLAVVAGMAGEVEDQAKIIRLMAEHGQSQPAALADMMLLQQRKLLEDIPSAFTNTTPALIDSLEALATTQDQTADLMIPLKGKLLQAMAQAQSSGSSSTNAQQQIAQVNAFAEAIRDQMFGVAAALRDLDRSAYSTATRAGESVYTLWKGLAGYQQLIREDILRQTNAITLTVPNLISPTDELRQSVRLQQAEAHALTTLFKERFEKTVPPEGLSRPVEKSSEPPAGPHTDATARIPPDGTEGAAPPAPSSGTNATEQILSPEDRKKIITLAGQAETIQATATGLISTNLTSSLARQRQAYALLKEIEKLLPKEKSPQNNQQQQKQDNQQNQEQQKKDQPQPKEQPKEQKQPEKQEPQKGQMSQEDLKRLLEKAKQREKEHEQEQRERNAAIPMSPTERDW